MRQLHAGAQRHVPQVRHLRQHDGVQLDVVPRRASHAISFLCEDMGGQPAAHNFGGEGLVGPLDSP
jgi:hypothetical protein